jgi:hypothetical protein
MPTDTITPEDIDAMFEAFEDFNLAPEEAAHLQAEFAPDKVIGRPLGDVMLAAEISLMGTFGLTKIHTHVLSEGSTMVSLCRPGDEDARRIAEAFAGPSSRSYS